MNPRFGDFTLKDRESHDDKEEDDRGGRGVLDLVVGDLLIDEEDDGLHRAWARGMIELAAGLTKETDYGVVFFEGADEGRDHDVKNLRGKERNGDAHRCLEASSAVDLRGIVILSVDVLEAAQEDEDLVWEAVPDDIEADGE